MPPSTTPTSGRRIPALLAVLAAQLIAGLLAVICMLVIFSWPTLSRSEMLRCFGLAIPFAEVTLLATWNALGDGKLVLRPIGSLVCVVGVWFIGVGAHEWLGYPTHDNAITAIAMFAQWIVVQVPLWIGRVAFGWQIGMIDQQNQAGGPKDVQFGIKHLIAWMTFVAIVLGTTKSLLLIESGDQHEFIAFGLFLLCNSMFAWPTVFGCLAIRWMPPAVLAAGVFAFSIAFAEPLVFQAVLGYNEGPTVFWWLNGIQFFWIAGSMLILRRFGFRLVRPRAI